MMDLNEQIFDTIRIEADSDFAFFGLASDDNTGLGSYTTTTASVGNDFPSMNNELNALLSSVSPFTITEAKCGGEMNGNLVHASPSQNFTPKQFSSSTNGCSSQQNGCSEVGIFSSDITEEMSLGMDDFSCDIGFITSSGRQSDGSESAETVSDASLYSPSTIDTPPLTPPSPYVKSEFDVNVLSPCSNSNSSKISSSSIEHGDMPPIVSVMKTPPTTTTSGANISKLLPALKSSRGRSASHDSPDLQALKRHIRMIRNRESASLSRKKKKEYVSTLEDKVKDLEIENFQLRQENQVLKTTLVKYQHENKSGTFAQPDKKPDISSFNRSSIIKLEPGKTKLIAKVALLGVCCLMLLAHPASRNQYSSEVNFNSSSNNGLESDMMQGFPDHKYFQSHSHTEGFPKVNHFKLSRTLTWSDGLKDTANNRHKHVKDNRVNGTSSWNYSNSTKDHQNPVTRRKVDIDLTHLSNKNNAKRKSGQHSYINSTLENPKAFAVPTASDVDCKEPFNKTELLRVQKDLKGLFSRGNPKRKNRPKPFFYPVLNVNDIDNNKGLTVYDKRINKYSRFLDEIKLREDTFYVVSLAMDDQLLLSAKSTNSSSRPKMSFLMPWRNDSLGGKEEVMQIDCEVTKVLNINVLRKNSKV